MLAFAFSLTALAFIGTASASVINDIPEAMNDALFDGASLYAAQLILTAAIMLSAALPLAMVKAPPAAMFIVLLCVLGALTAIGWADISLMVAAIMIMVGMFGGKMAEYLSGNKSGG